MLNMTSGQTFAVVLAIILCSSIVAVALITAIERAAVYIANTLSPYELHAQTQHEKVMDTDIE